MKIALIALGLVALSGVVLFALYQRWEMVDPPIGPILLIMLPVQISAVFVIRHVFAIKGSGIMVFVLIFCGVYVLFGHAAALNAWLDDGPRTRHRVKVVERNHQRGGFRSTIVESWHTRGDTEKLWIPLRVDDLPEIVVVTGEGWFGCEWVDDVVAPD